MVSKSRSLKRKVYLISPNKIYPNFFTDLKKVLLSKQVSFFQLRLKNNNKNQIIKIAKKNLKNKIIGVTCHNSKALALQALKDKASYVAFGSFFNSKLKPNAKKANLKILNWAKRNIKKPIVAIGGINEKNYKKLIKAGANYIAISTVIWNNPFLKPEIAIKKFK